MACSDIENELPLFVWRFFLAWLLPLSLAQMPFAIGLSNKCFLMVHSISWLLVNTTSKHKQLSCNSSKSKPTNNPKLMWLTTSSPSSTHAIYLRASHIWLHVPSHTMRYLFPRFELVWALFSLVNYWRLKPFPFKRIELLNSPRERLYMQCLLVASTSIEAAALCLSSDSDCWPMFSRRLNQCWMMGRSSHSFEFLLI